MQEIWKDVVNYEGVYSVSNLGRVKSLDRVVKFKNTKRPTKGRVLKNRIQQHGYYCVNLSYNGTKKNIEVHKLVAMAFLDHQPNGHNIVVDHIDGNKLNNCECNLQLVSNRVNSSKDQKKLNRTSEYIGVTWNKAVSKWKTHIRHKGKQYFIGYFKNEFEASVYYQNALRNIQNNANFITVIRSEQDKRILL